MNALIPKRQCYENRKKKNRTNKNELKFIVSKVKEKTQRTTKKNSKQKKKFSLFVSFSF